MKVSSQVMQAIDAYSQQIRKSQFESMNPNVGNVANGDTSFKDMVIQFNKMSQMSQAEIIAKVAASRATTNTQNLHSHSNILNAASATAELRRMVMHSEKTSLDYAAGRASGVDMSSSISQASSAISFAVSLRNKMQEALDKLFNINM